MVNAISEEIARGEANPQPFHPYVVPNYHEHPWLPRITAHVNAYNTWKTKAKGTKKQAISLQQWLHRHIRFVITAEMCSLWTPFGGLAAQFNHIAVLLTLATLESAGFAIRYHELLVRTLSDYARARFPFDYFTALSEIHEDTKRAINTDSTRPASMAPPPANAQLYTKGGKNRYSNGKKGKPTGGKGNKTKGKQGKGGNPRQAGKGPTPPPVAPPAATT